MRIRFTPLTEQDARAIAAWRYPAPYDFYNWRPTDDPAALAMPVARFYAARTEHSELVGYACYGLAAQVPGGDYAAELLDVGLGLRPDFTGRGHGLAFVREVLAFARAEWQPSGFRLTVATFNRRAIRTYERAGFRPGPRFWHPEQGTAVEFMLMTRPADDAESLQEQGESPDEDQQPAGA